MKIEEVTARVWIKGASPIAAQRVHDAARRAAREAAHREAQTIELEKRAETERADRDAHSPPEIEAAETESLAHRIEKLESALAKHVGTMSAMLTLHDERVRAIDDTLENLRRETPNPFETFDQWFDRRVKECTFCNAIDMTVVDDKIEKLAKKLSEVSTAAQGWYQHFYADVGGRWAPIDDKFGAVQKRLDKLEGNQSNTTARLLKLGKLLATADVAVR